MDNSEDFLFSPIENIIEDLRAGKPIILVDDQNRENEGDIVFAAQYASYDLIQLLVDRARGLICTPLSEDIAKRLELPPMVSSNTDHYQTAFTVSVDAFENTTTGISVQDRLETILKLGNKEAEAGDFRRPGHVFPLIAKPGGVLERRGHTEGSTDLLKLAGLYPAAVICEILNLDGSMARLEKDLLPLSQELGIKICAIEQIVEYRRKHQQPIFTLVASANLPTKYGVFQIQVFTNPLDSKEHVALSMGELAGKEDVLVRIHSSCLTGDAFHSLKCDCGDQLVGAMKMIQDKGEGVIIYLSQEGRGIGLVNKIKAYALQEEGLDTVLSNEALGFPPDLRDYEPAIQILKYLQIQSVNLLTNNPEKLEALADAGIPIHRRSPSIVEPYPQREGYLKTKKEKMRHLL